MKREYYSIPQAAHILGVCPGTLRRWIARKQIHPDIILPSKRKYFSREMLDRIISPSNEEIVARVIAGKKRNKERLDKIINAKHTSKVHK